MKGVYAEKGWVDRGKEQGKGRVWMRLDFSIASSLAAFHSFDYGYDCDCDSDSDSDSGLILILRLPRVGLLFGRSPFGL